MTARLNWRKARKDSRYKNSASLLTVGRYPKSDYSSEITHMKLSYRLFVIVNRILLRWNIVLTPTLFQQPRGHASDIADRAFDFTRMATIKAVLDELDKRGTKGALAELGVYRGGTSVMMNAWSPDRILYLMDTFEGFDNRDLEVERDREYSTGKMEFKETSVDSVLAIMPHPQKCKIVKGFFPDSAVDISDTFAFAMIDVDLFQPIYEGLKWFWPKMVSGGTIMVHDFGTEKFKGARVAVRKFSEEEGLAYLPLPDTAGSVVFLKN